MSCDLTKIMLLHDEGSLRCVVRVVTREDGRELCHLARQMHQDGNITTMRVLLVRNGPEVEELYLTRDDFETLSGEASEAERRAFAR